MSIFLISGLEDRQTDSSGVTWHLTWSAVSYSLTHSLTQTCLAKISFIHIEQDWDLPQLVFLTTSMYCLFYQTKFNNPQKKNG